MKKNCISHNLPFHFLILVKKKGSAFRISIFRISFETNLFFSWPNTRIHVVHALHDDCAVDFMVVNHEIER